MTGPGFFANRSGHGSGALDAPPEENAPGAGSFGLSLFLVSLAVLFLGTIVAYVVVQRRADAWPPGDAPSLPIGMWASSALLILGSVAIERALASVRSDRTNALRKWLGVTLGFAVAFLACQTVLWVQLAPPSGAEASLFLFLFFFITGLHAAHVVGAIVPLAVVTTHARRGRYSSRHHTPVAYCARYWHFLGGVWLVLFAMLALSG